LVRGKSYRPARAAAMGKFPPRLFNKRLETQNEQGETRLYYLQ
jgi:hypothetical protein